MFGIGTFYAKYSWCKYRGSFAKLTEERSFNILLHAISYDDGELRVVVNE